MQKSLECHNFNCRGNSYAWDCEGRLTVAETLTNLPSSVPRVKVDFVYDYMSRRVGKAVYNWISNDWSLVETRVNVFNGWDLIREEVVAEQTTTNWYVHGIDLSGSLTGAGGIGGLLTAKFGTNTYLYTYCANGNVSELVDADTSTIAAHYEFSPYGQTIVATGPMAQENEIQFSTKPVEDNTGLVLYEYRPYLPSLGRWLSQDPIGEDGGYNLYSICQNNLIDRKDYLGLTFYGRQIEARDVDVCGGSYGRVSNPYHGIFGCVDKVGVADFNMNITEYWYAKNIGIWTSLIKSYEENHYNSAVSFYNEVNALVVAHDGKVYRNKCECEDESKIYGFRYHILSASYEAAEARKDVFHSQVARVIQAALCPGGKCK